MYRRRSEVWLRVGNRRAACEECRSELPAHRVLVKSRMLTPGQRSISQRRSDRQWRSNKLNPGAKMRRPARGSFAHRWQFWLMVWNDSVQPERVLEPQLSSTKTVKAQADHRFRPRDQGSD